MNRETSNRAATIVFFLILQKGKPHMVLPKLLEPSFMETKEIEALPIGKILKGPIRIFPEDPPWSDIPEGADAIFLAIQSRKDWGEALSVDSNLLRVKTIKNIVLKMEESLNNGTFRKDLLSGKFESPELTIENDFSKSMASTNKDEQGIDPGQNWL